MPAYETKKNFRWALRLVLSSQGYELTVHECMRLVMLRKKLLEEVMTTDDIHSVPAQLSFIAMKRVVKICFLRFIPCIISTYPQMQKAAQNQATQSNDLLKIV